MLEKNVWHYSTFHLFCFRTGLVLPKLASPLDPRVILVKPSLYDPNKVAPTEYFSFAHCFQQVRNYILFGLTLFEAVLSIILIKNRVFKFTAILKTLTLIFKWFLFRNYCLQIKYLEDDAYMINGCINIIDLEGITMTHFMQMTPTVLKKLVIAGQVKQTLDNRIRFAILPRPCIIYVDDWNTYTVWSFIMPSEGQALLIL